jgi:tetratricopeptide (TPR) repeat protein
MIHGTTMNLKHLRNASAIIAILGLSLLPVAPAKALVLLEPAYGSFQQEDTETPPISITFTGWPLHMLLGGTAGLMTLSVMLLIDKTARDRADKLQQQSKGPSHKHYIKAIESGDNYGNWLELGTTLARNDQHEDALECFDRAIKHQPFAADAWKGLGDSLFALRRFQEALNAYNAEIESKKYPANHLHAEPDSEYIFGGY